MLPDSPYKGKKVHLFWAAAVPEYMKSHTVWQHASLKKILWSLPINRYFFFLWSFPIWWSEETVFKTPQLSKKSVLPKSVARSPSCTIDCSILSGWSFPQTSNRLLQTFSVLLYSQFVFLVYWDTVKHLVCWHLQTLFTWDKR